jgi:hypothetical protein
MRAALVMDTYLFRDGKLMVVAIAGELGNTN